MTNQNQPIPMKWQPQKPNTKPIFILPANTNIIPTFNKVVLKIPIKYQENTKKFETYLNTVTESLKVRSKAASLHNCCRHRHRGTDWNQFQLLLSHNTRRLRIGLAQQRLGRTRHNSSEQLGTTCRHSSAQTAGSNRPGNPFQPALSSTASTTLVPHSSKNPHPRRAATPLRSQSPRAPVIT